MATLTVFAEAGDGDTSNAALTAGQTWTNCRNGTGGTLYVDDTATSWQDPNYGQGAGRFKDGNARWVIMRDHCPFDTSALTSDATISAATINLKPNSHASGGGDFVIITESTVTSPTDLVAADFTQVGFIAWSDSINYADLVDDTYSVFTLNASGIAGIDKTGYSHFALLSGADQTNSEPVAGTASRVNMRSSEFVGTTSDPYIEITYTSGSLTNVKTWNGIAIANVKTVNDVPIASVKTINGLN